LVDWQVTEPRGCIYELILQYPMTDLNTVTPPYSRGPLTRLTIVQ